MSIQITYFVHGTTTDNEKEISSGWSDVELSDLGIKQSIDLREKTKDKTFDVVFCSDLQRAVRLAEVAWEGIYPIIPDSRLRECNYGKLNGASSGVVEPMQEEECITNRFPGGESYEDVKVRIADFLEFLKKNYDGKRVAIVAHKAPQLALDVLIKGKTWKQALAEDWRKTKAWQPGWDYILHNISDKLGSKTLLISVIEKDNFILMRKKPAGSLPYKETWYLFGAEAKAGQEDSITLAQYLKGSLGIDIDSIEFVDEDSEVKQDHDGLVK